MISVRSVRTDRGGEKSGVPTIAAHRLTALVVLLLVLTVGVEAWSDSRARAQNLQTVDIGRLMPITVPGWREVHEDPRFIVDPQAQATVDKVYSQVLNRLYVDDSGYQVMLTIAYGGDRERGLTAHRPEVCYPAQGFTIEATEATTLHTRFGDIPADRFEARRGTRSEPLTFWFTFGSSNVRGALERRLANIRYHLSGQIPGGLLFRVSSLDGEPVHGYQRQAAFVEAFLDAAGPEARRNFAGLRTPIGE